MCFLSSLKAYSFQIRWAFPLPPPPCPLFEDVCVCVHVHTRAVYWSLIFLYLAHYSNVVRLGFCGEYAFYSTHCRPHSVSFCSGCHNKILQTGGNRNLFSKQQKRTFSTTETYFLTVLETRRPRSKCEQGWGLVRPLFLACRRLTSACVLTWPFFCEGGEAL